MDGLSLVQIANQRFVHSTQNDDVLAGLQDVLLQYVLKCSEYPLVMVGAVQYKLILLGLSHNNMAGADYVDNHNELLFPEYSRGQELIPWQYPRIL